MSLLDAYRRNFEEDAANWRVRPSVGWLVMLVPLLGLAVFAVIAAYSGLTADRMPLDVAFAEDGIVEWAQFFILLAIAGLAAVVALRFHRAGSPVPALLYLVAAIGAAFIAGEEISWGQRVFGIGTPQWLADVNRQDELNIHNVPILQQMFGLAS